MVGKHWQGSEGWGLCGGPGGEATYWWDAWVLRSSFVVKEDVLNRNAHRTVSIMRRATNADFTIEYMEQMDNLKKCTEVDGVISASLLLFSVGFDLK